VELPVPPLNSKFRSDKAGVRSFVETADA